MHQTFVLRYFPNKRSPWPSKNLLYLENDQHFSWGNIPSNSRVWLDEKGSSPNINDVDFTMPLNFTIYFNRKDLLKLKLSQNFRVPISAFGGDQCPTVGSGDIFWLDDDLLRQHFFIRHMLSNLLAETSPKRQNFLMKNKEKMTLLHIVWSYTEKRFKQNKKANGIFLIFYWKILLGSNSSMKAFMKLLAFQMGRKLGLWMNNFI